MTARAITQLRKRRAAVRVLSTALALSAISWYLGGDVWHSILFGSAVTTVMAAGSAALGAEVGETIWRGGRRVRREGSRHDVADLSWLLRGRGGRAGLAGGLRVKRIARQRLALRHLDLESPADRAQVERLIGRPAYRLLTDIGSRPVKLRALDYCLDALDALDPVHYPAPRPRPRRRGLTSINPTMRRARER